MSDNLGSENVWKTIRNEVLEASENDFWDTTSKLQLVQRQLG